MGGCVPLPALLPSTRTKISEGRGIRIGEGIHRRGISLGPNILGDGHGGPGISHNGPYRVPLPCLEGHRQRITCASPRVTGPIILLYKDLSIRSVVERDPPHIGLGHTTVHVIGQDHGRIRPLAYALCARGDLHVTFNHIRPSAKILTPIAKFQRIVTAA